MELGSDQARAELPAKEQKMTKNYLLGSTAKTERFLSSKSLKATNDLSGSVQSQVHNILFNAIQYDQTLKQTLDALASAPEITDALPTYDAAGKAVNVPARLETIARTNITSAVNLARQDFFGSPELKGFVQAYEYSAILDDRTTEVCQHLNGKIMRDFSYYTPPNHFNCRSILIPITVLDEWDGKESPSPRVEPNKGFGIGK